MSGSVFGMNSLCFDSRYVLLFCFEQNWARRFRRDDASLLSTKGFWPPFRKKNTNFLSLCWSGSWVVVYWIKNVDRLHLYCGSRQVTFKKIRHLRLVLLLLACQYEFVWEEWPVFFTFVWICYIRIHLILILFKGSDGSSGGGGGGGGGSGGGSGICSKFLPANFGRTTHRKISITENHRQRQFRQSETSQTYSNWQRGAVHNGSIPYPFLFPITLSRTSAVSYDCIIPASSHE